MRKRILSTLLALCLVLGMLPQPAYTIDTSKTETTATTISAGEYHSGIIDYNDSLWMWGGNELGQLGNGTKDTALSPIKVMDNVKSISVGTYHTAAIQTDGSLWIWGCNHEGELGNGITGNDEGYIWDSWGGDNYPIQTVPVKVMENVSAVSCGNEFTAAIQTDGSLWMWGSNQDGQIGNGTTETVTEPEKIMENVVAVCAGSFHTTALQSDGTLWSWGNNDYGLKTDNNSVFPVKILDNVASIAEGAHNTAAVREDGSLWMRGWISYDGLYASTSDIMVQVLPQVSSVSLGYSHYSVIMPDNSLWMWGNGDYGRLGLPSGTQSDPAKMSQSTMDDVVLADIGHVHTIAVKSDGSVWTWGGQNTSGQLGNGSTSSSELPTQIPGLIAKVPGNTKPDIPDVPDVPDIPDVPASSDGRIVSLFPANGATDVGYDASNPPVFRIEFDQEIASAYGQEFVADVDLAMDGGFSIRCASNDELVYEPTEYSRFHFTLDQTKKILTIKPLNNHVLLDPSTQYYVTMDKGFVRFVDGTGSPAIQKGDWVFTTEQFEENGTFSFPNADGTQDISYKYIYEDDFFANANTKYDHDLAKMSLCLALSAFNSTKAPANGYTEESAGQNVKKLLKSTGFSDIDISSYNGKPTDTSIAAAFGKKNITVGSDVYTLIAVAVRGSGYEMEWANNFRVVSSDRHLGFSMSASSVKTMLMKYIGDHILVGNETPKIKLWITGYSRGGAIANLVGADLIDYARSGYFDSSFLLDEQNIYTYTFATPMATADSERESYQNIFNVINPIDVVPKTTPASWGFGRNGITYFLPSYETQQKVFQNHVQDVVSESIKLSGHNYIRVFHTAQGSILDTALDATEIIGANSDVSLAIQNFIAEKQIEKYSNTNVDRSFIDLYGIYEDIKSWSKIIGSGDVIAGSIKAAWEGIKYVVKNAKDEIVDIIEMAHYPEVYLAWMNVVADVNSLNCGISRYLYVNCPVNISVYDSSNQLVAQIVEDEIQDFAGVSVGVYIDANNQKIIVLPTDEEYRIVLTATDTGVVTYTVAEHSMDTGTINRLVSYFETEVNDGDILTGVIENLDNIPSAKYPLYQNENDVSLSATIDQTGNEINKYAVTVSTSGNGTAIGGGTYVSGEFAKVTATANIGNTFSGWYMGNTLVSSDTEYRFLVDKDVSLIAKFTEDPAFPDTPVTPAPSYPSPSSPDNTVTATTYSITIQTVTNGKIIATTSSASKGTTVTLTATPDAGYELASLTATDSKGNVLKLTDKGNGKYTFTMPGSKVTVEASFSAIAPAEPPAEPQTTPDPVPVTLPFTDVLPADWFYSAVQYVYANGLMTGETASSFAPNAPMTRAMVWTVLGRLSGADVNGGAPWYANAQAWAVSAGVSDGTDPDGSITREQLVTMLYRQAESPAAPADLSGFKDRAAVSDWAAPAVQWAVASGLLLGDNGNLNPTASASRAEVAALLMRFCQNAAI